MNPGSPHTEHSAGGVLWREMPGGDIEVCLIATRGSTRWQLPKGHISPGETDAEAARREVREETGCDGEIEDDLGPIEFGFLVGPRARRRRITKTVRFYLVRYLGGETRDHDGEVDEAVWLNARQALGRLTFDSERRILAQAIERLHERHG